MPLLPRFVPCWLLPALTGAAVALVADDTGPALTVWRPAFPGALENVAPHS